MRRPWAKIYGYISLRISRGMVRKTHVCTGLTTALVVEEVAFGGSVVLSERAERGGKLSFERAGATVEGAIQDSSNIDACKKIARDC